MGSVCILKLLCSKNNKIANNLTTTEPRKISTKLELGINRILQRMLRSLDKMGKISNFT